jgi:hypothetical protein
MKLFVSVALLAALGAGVFVGINLSHRLMLTRSVCQQMILNDIQSKNQFMSAMRHLDAEAIMSEFPIEQKGK